MSHYGFMAAGFDSPAVFNNTAWVTTLACLFE
jgi:hypothetical protein